MYRRAYLTQSDEVAFSVLLYYHCVKSVTNNHFVSSDLLIYYLNWTGVTSKMEVSTS